MVDVHSTLCRTVGVSWWMCILHFVGRYSHIPNSSIGRNNSIGRKKTKM